MARKSDTFVVLQFDERRIHALRVRPSEKGVRVLDDLHEDGYWPSPEALGEALETFAGTHRLAGMPLYLVLPRHEIAARTLVLPSQEEHEIRGMVRLNAEEYVPYPVEDLAIDQCILQRLPDGQARVLAAFAQRDHIEARIDLLRQARMVPDRVFLSTTCLAAAALALRPVPEEPYALVDVGAGGVEVLVLQGKRLLYGRAAASHRNGSLATLAPPEVAEEAALELRASLSAFRREAEDEVSVDRVFMACDWSDAAALCDHVAGQTGCACEPAAPLARALVSTDALVADRLPLAALGAALAVQGRAPLVIDLTPESLRATREAARQRRVWAVGGVLLGVVAILSAAWYALEVRQRTAYLRDLRELEARYAPQAETVREKSRQLSILQRQVDPAGSALEVLARASDSAPAEDITFLQFSYDRGQKAEIRGRALATQLVDRLAQDLRDAGGVYATAKRGGMTLVPEWDNRQVTEYVITIDLAGAAEDEDGGAATDEEDYDE